MAASEDLLFVYGTLRRAGRNPIVRMPDHRADFIGVGTFRGKLYDLGSYPGAVPSTDAADRVTGEVYALHDPDRAFPILDSYETSEYSREKHLIRLENGDTVQAWIYIYIAPTDTFRRIESGDYPDAE